MKKLRHCHPVYIKRGKVSVTFVRNGGRGQVSSELDGCIVWNAHNTVLGEEAPLICIVPVCYVKTGRYGKT